MSRGQAQEGDLKPPTTFLCPCNFLTHVWIFLFVYVYIFFNPSFNIYQLCNIGNTLLILIGPPFPYS